VLPKEDVITLLNQAMEVFKKEPNMLTLSDPVTVVGDLHGQYYDLLKIFELGGEFGKVK
jgi:serine/threonine-protein phosphatase 2B catalytic subunit